VQAVHDRCTKLLRRSKRNQPDLRDHEHLVELQASGALRACHPIHRTLHHSDMLSRASGWHVAEYGTYEAEGVVKVARLLASFLKCAGSREAASVGDPGAGLGELLLGIRATSLLPAHTKYTGVEVVRDRADFATELATKSPPEEQQQSVVKFFAGE
jgi:hypothetical protein